MAAYENFESNSFFWLETAKVHLGGFFCVFWTYLVMAGHSSVGDTDFVVSFKKFLRCN